jgi:CSLREA domain-containing protein
MTAAAIAAPAASAATLTVNSTFDETNSGDGSCSLREAILAVDSPGSAGGDCAPAAFGANTIVLKASRYFLGNGGVPHTPLQIASTVTSLTIQGAGES